MIEEVTQTLNLLCTLIFSVSQPNLPSNLTSHKSIDAIAVAPRVTQQRRPARDPFAGGDFSAPTLSSESFVQPKIPTQPEYPVAVLSFDESANQVLTARPVVVRRQDPRTGKRTLKQVVDLSEMISRSAEREGIDPKLVEIVIEHESAFDPSAASGVGACGLMQLMPETAKDLGVTDITDPEQNIAAGTKYLAQQLRHYQDLPLALAAYNAGPGNVDYYGAVPPFEETQNYSSSISREYMACRVARYAD